MLKLEGQKFGKLKVISKQGFDKSRHIYWLCKCDCGNMKVVRTDHLTLGHTKSCGRLAIVQAHGMKKTAAYARWQNMLKRCRNKNNKDYKEYGARGITVCERWLDFKNFYKDMGKCPPGLTLERIDNDKGYSPDNCKWATMKEQSNNSRMNVVIEYRGLKLTMKQWSEKIGILYNTLHSRIRKSNWPIGKALTEPICKPKVVLSPDGREGVSLPQRDHCALRVGLEMGHDDDSLRRRVRRRDPGQLGTKGPVEPSPSWPLG